MNVQQNNKPCLDGLSACCLGAVCLLSRSYLPVGALMHALDGLMKSMGFVTVSVLDVHLFMGSGKLCPVLSLVFKRFSGLVILI